MLDRIKALLFESGLAKTPQAAAFAEAEVAAVVLLIEAATADGGYGEAENAAILDLVMRKMKLDRARAADLIALADARHLQAVELFKFTDAAKRGLNEDERAGLVEMLWEVVYADGRLDDYEDRLVRKVAGLLHVTDRARGDARRRVLDRLGSTRPDDGRG